MGYQNAVDVATAVHANILASRGLLPYQERLAFDTPVPKSRQWSGIYIDDWLLVRMIRRAEARLPSLDSERAVQVSAAYEEVGLPDETDKAFNAKVDFKAWGAELRGGIETLGAPVATRFQLFLLTTYQSARRGIRKLSVAYRD